MDGNDRVASSRTIHRRMPSARPTTMRPNTGVRPLTTGLLIPKSSRGRTAASLRRQVHDKSYWMAVLTSKLTELQNEIGRLSRLSEHLQKEQARGGLLQKSAEQSARELQDKNNALIVLNEYFERLRLPDSLQDVRDETEMLVKDNEQLGQQLEQLYARKRNGQTDLEKMSSSLNSLRNRSLQLRRQMDEQQQKRFSLLEQQNQRLTERVSAMQIQLAQLRRTQQRLERLHSADGGLLQRRELLHALRRCRELQQQADQLRSDRVQPPEERRLAMLAEAKLNKQRLDALTQQKNDLERQLVAARSKLQAYDHPETVAKFSELSNKKRMMSDFLTDFESNKATEQRRVDELGEQVNRLRQHLTRMNRRQKRLQARKTDESEQLLKRCQSLQLDNENMRQLQNKAEREILDLKEQMEKLRAELGHIERLDELRDELNHKLQEQQKTGKQLQERDQRLTQTLANKREQLKQLQTEIEQNELVTRLDRLQARLFSVQNEHRFATNQLQELDYAHLKNEAMQLVSKLNQRLLGF